MNWNVIFARHALKDANKLAAAGLKENALSLIEVLGKNPFQRPPPYEKLIGNLAGTFSRRINIQHRLVYEVFKDQKTVRILRMWSHYE